MQGFHLIGLPGAEGQFLPRAVRALEEVRSGESVFFSEWVPRNLASSPAAFVRLSRIASERRINVFAPLLLGGDLVEDLPGNDASLYYSSLCIFTRFGMVHVPQAKIAPYAMEAGRPVMNTTVAPYGRLNLVPLDLDGRILQARFFLGADLMALSRFNARTLACDLVVVMGSFGKQEDSTVLEMLGEVLKSGAASTALLVSGIAPGDTSKARATEEVLDSSAGALRNWNRRSMRSRFFVYRGEKMPSSTSAGRLGIARSCWDAKIRLGRYPVTVVLG